MTSKPRSSLRRLGEALISIGAFPGKLAGWLILPMVVTVLWAVAASVMRQNELLSWSADLPLLGTHLSLTGISELQWHLMAVLVMLSIPYALAEGRHVSVDLFSSRLGPRSNAVIELVGDIILLIPFAAVLLWFSWDFTMFAQKMGEQSANGGLVDRWLIKAFLPLGAGLLLITAAGRILVLLDRVIWPAALETAAGGPEHG